MTESRRTREEIEREMEEVSNRLLALEGADPEGEGSPEEDSLRKREAELTKELDAILEAEQTHATQQKDKYVWKENDVQITQPETQETEVQPKVNGNTLRAAKAAVAKKQISADSFRAIEEGELSLQEARTYGRDADRHGNPVGPAPKKVNKKDRSRNCMCGCGRTTNGRFAMGHDARVKGWIVKAVREGTFDQISDEIQEYAYERNLVAETEVRMADEEAKRAERAKAKAAAQRTKEGEQEKQKK